MEQRTLDKRAKKTRGLLKKALSELMREKPVNEITVRELSQRCQINRGTFYLHYRDVYDMLDKLEREVYNDLSQMLSTIGRGAVDAISPILNRICAYIDDNRDVCGAILGKNGSAGFVSRFSEFIKTRYFDVWSDGRARDAKMIEHAFDFAISGVFGLIRVWLDSDSPEPPEKIAKLTFDLVVNGTLGAIAPAI